MPGYGEPGTRLATALRLHESRAVRATVSRGSNPTLSANVAINTLNCKAFYLA